MGKWMSAMSGSCTENCRFTFQCQLEAESLNMHNTVGLSIQFNTQGTARPRVFTNIRTHIHTHRVWFTLQKKYIYRYTEYVGPKLTKRLTNITKISQLCVYLPFPLTIFHVFVRLEEEKIHSIPLREEYRKKIVFVFVEWQLFIIPFSCVWWGNSKNTLRFCLEYFGWLTSF